MKTYLKSQAGGATLIVVAMTATIAVYVTSSVMNQMNLASQRSSMARDHMAVLMVTPAIAQRIVTFRDRTPPSGGDCVQAGGPSLVRRDINGISMCVPEENQVSSLSCIEHPWLAGEQVCFSLPGANPTVPVSPTTPTEPTEPQQTPPDYQPDP